MIRMSLARKSCIPSKSDTHPLTLEQAVELLGEIPTWELVGAKKIECNLSFSNFAQALAFVNAAGEICEQENHHADFELGWGRVGIQIWTHDINGLTESDFILAAKIDEVC
jgi:4a-hydroxytetrahydrobiopterin dehydratase